MRTIKSFIHFTYNMLAGYFSNLKNLNSNKDLFWDIRWTFFEGNNAKKYRDEYVIKVDNLFKTYK